MQNIWEVLGIEKTTDVKQIKRAYAAKAKEWHPEEHPQEYQMLQKAYKSALQAAKMQTSGELFVEAPVSEPAPDTEKGSAGAEGEPEFLTQPVLQETTVEWNHRLDFGEVQRNRTREVCDRFFKEFRYIVWNQYLKDNFYVWRSFLSCPEYQELFKEEDFLREFLSTVSNYSYWKKEVLDLFEERLEDLSKNGVDTKGAWKKIRFACRRDELLSVEGVTLFKTGTWKVHELMLERIKGRGVEVIGRISNRKEANSYLECYLPYAAENEYFLKKDYEKLCHSRRGLGIIKLVIILAVLLAGLLLCTWVVQGRRPSREDNIKQLEEGISELERLRQEMEEAESELKGIRLEIPEVSPEVEESLEEMFH